MLSATFFYSLPLLLRFFLNGWKTRPDWIDALFYAAALACVLIFIGTSTGFIYARF
jgi:ABC-type polysaccharide/polyol phosphate export permease